MPIKIPRCEKKKEKRSDGETRVVHQTLTLIKKKKWTYIFVFHFNQSWCLQTEAPVLFVFVGEAAKHNLVVIFPQICRWEEWSPAPSALAQWLCWHRPKLSTPTPILFPGLAECNTSLTKSHFPFLSNFHTPTPPSSLSLPPPTGETPGKKRRNCGDKRMPLFHLLRRSRHSPRH